jgi:hypothetical protein
MAMLFPQMHPMFNDPNRWMPLPSNYQAPPTPPTSGFDGYIPGPVPGDIPGGGGGGDGRIFPPGPYRPGPFDPDEELPPAEPPPPPPPPPMADNYGFGSAGAGDVGEALSDPYSGIGPGTHGLLGPMTPFGLRDTPGLYGLLADVVTGRFGEQKDLMDDVSRELSRMGINPRTPTREQVQNAYSRVSMQPVGTTGNPQLDAAYSAMGADPATASEAEASAAAAASEGFPGYGMGGIVGGEGWI